MASLAAGLRAAGRRPRAAVRAEPRIAALTALAALGYGAYAVLRHVHLRSGLDLAIFDQAIWHYSRFETPASTIAGQPNLLGDHFHPILALLAPLYWIWSDPRTLLIAQAVLVAASIVPVYLFARDRIGRRPAELLALAYALFWGVQTGIGYEFHEVAFAPLLIALVVLFADRRAGARYWLALVALLCVKEDLSVLVMAVGIWLLTLRQTRRGLITLALGIAWYELATRVAIPHFNPEHKFTYWSYTQLGSSLPNALGRSIVHPFHALHVLVTPAQKVHTMLWLFLPFLFLSLRSRLVILMVPLLLERFLSVKTGFWGTAYHYSLAISPVLAMGAADGLAWIGRRRPAAARERALSALGAAMVVVGLAVTIGAVRGSPPRELTHGFFHDPPYGADARAALALIPSQASVAAPDFLVPHLAERQVVTEIQPLRPLTEYVIADLGEPIGQPTGNASFRDEGLELDRRIAVATPILYRDGWIVLRRSSHPGNGVLAPLGVAKMRVLTPLVGAWEQQLAGAGGELAACDSELGKGGGAACFSAAGSTFRLLHAQLVAEIGRALAGARGGCAPIGAGALAAAHELAHDVELTRAAGIAGDAARVARAATQSQHDVNDRDLAGRVQRFLLLCTPRA